MRRLLRALVAVSMLAALVSTASAAAPLSASSTPGGGFVPGEVTVGLEPGTEAQGVAAALSGRIDRTLLAGQTIVISVGNPVAAAALARALPGVRYAEPNWIRGLHSHDTGFEKPNDGGFDLKWDLHNDGSLSDGSDQSLHGADMNWLAAYNSLQSVTLAPTVVAVLDTGVDLNHPDLKLTAGWDFIANDSSPEDGFGHGTHVAGIVGARTNNGANSADVDTAGVAFSSAITVMPIKVCDNNGSCPSDAIANGIRWAADHGARVINMSFGGPEISQTEIDAISYASGKGVLLVASAGNSNVATQNYPAAHEPVMAIAATDWRDGKASYSNYGASWVDLTAPGGDMTTYDDPEGIYSTMPTYGVFLTSCRARGLLSPCYDLNYDQLAGTSMAAPQVAGAAGLLFAMGVPASDVRGLLQTTANGIAGTGNLWANGRLDVGAAVAAAGPAPTPGSISGTVTDASAGPILGATVTVEGTALSSLTDVNGLYTIFDVPTGTYTVTASATGYVSQSQSDVQVNSGEDTPVDFVLSPEPPPPDPGSVSGTVTESGGGTAIAGATVTAQGNGMSRSTTTGSDGSYTISDLPAGSYTVTASATEYLSQSEENVNVTEGTATTGVNFALEPAPAATTMHVGDLDGSSVNNGSTWTAVVTIQVVDSAGSPVASATVSGSWNGSASVVTCSTNSNGLCQLSLGGVAKRVGSVSFTVTNVTHGSLAYETSANTDPDGDSDGTTITVTKP